MAAAASSSGLKKVDVRAIVPAAKLSSLTGRQYVSAAENNHATPEIHGCSYQGAGGDQSMLTFDLAIDYGGGSTDLNAEVDQIKDDGENPISLSTLASSNAKAVSQLVIAQYGQDDAYAVDALYPSGTRELTTAQLIQVVKALVAGSR